MRFVARIDDRPPNHRVQIHERFEKIRPLRNLIVDGAGLVFRADLAGPGAPRTDRAITAALLLLTTMIAFENMAVATAMPVVAAELGALGSYGLAFSSMMTAMLLGIVLAGPWTDRAGPLAPVFWGQAFFAMGAIVCGAAPSFGVLLVGRVITGLGAGLVIVVVFVVLAVFAPWIAPYDFNQTRVDGEKLPMGKGDLILTPPGLWHEHGHDGSGPVIWLDALDLPLVYGIELTSEKDLASAAAEAAEDDLL